jgi:hypothetical protein
MIDTLEIVETLPPMHPGELLREEFMNPLGFRRALSPRPSEFRERASSGSSRARRASARIPF